LKKPELTASFLRCLEAAPSGFTFSLSKIVRFCVLFFVAFPTGDSGDIITSKTAAHQIEPNRVLCAVSG
jgi:hypothetical protein